MADLQSAALIHLATPPRRFVSPASWPRPRRAEDSSRPRSVRSRSFAPCAADPKRPPRHSRKKRGGCSRTTAHNLSRIAWARCIAKHNRSRTALPRHRQAGGTLYGIPERLPRSFRMNRRGAEHTMGRPRVAAAARRLAADTNLTTPPVHAEKQTGHPVGGRLTFSWCAREDSNLHPLEYGLGPEPSASANSATSAQFGYESRLRPSILRAPEPLSSPWTCFPEAPTCARH